MGNCIGFTSMEEEKEVVNEDQGCDQLISGHNNNSDSGRGSLQESVSKTTRDYCMTHRSRGRCIIINNQKFDRKEERLGSDKDAEALEKCFSNLKFHVQPHVKDKTASEIQSYLKQLSRQDFTNDDCLVVCVLTHGDLGVLWGRDNPYTVEDLISPFIANRCPSLAGKPKIFFIQACQGSKYDTGAAIGQCKEEIDAEGQYFKIPVMADFLVMYPTYPYYYAWRNTFHGSWFVQALVSILNKNHTDTDLLSMLTMVNWKVAHEYMTSDGYKEIPCVNSMLTRKVYFSSNTFNNDSKTDDPKTLLFLQYL